MLPTNLLLARVVDMVVCVEYYLVAFWGGGGGVDMEVCVEYYPVAFWGGG